MKVVLSSDCKKELSATQWGFPSGRSTVTALLSVTQDWFTALESGKEICAIFVDYQKAFDSVPHAPLLAKLTDLQFSPILLQWLTDYLTNRMQFVVVNGAESHLAPVLSGVPQESILGPLLFLLYIDELSSISFSYGSRLHLYADDVLLYSVVESNPAAFFCVQDDISKIAQWSFDNSLTLNHSKCKYMVLSRKKKPTVPSTPLLLNGQPLAHVTSIKYLGVILTNNVTLSEHVNSVCTKATRILDLIFQKYYNHASCSSLLQLYKSLVLSHLE